MANRNKTNGDQAERALVDWLRVNGYPDACRARGEAVDRGDIGGVPGTCVQVKRAASERYVMARLREAQAGALVQAQGRRPVAVVRLPRVTDPAQWWAATQVRDMSWSTFTRRYDLPIDAVGVGPRCSYVTLGRAIDERGGAFRGAEWVDVIGGRVRVAWWVTTVERLFSTLREAT